MEYLAATGVCTCLISVLRMRTSFRYEHCFLIKLSPTVCLSSASRAALCERAFNSCFRFECLFLKGAAPPPLPPPPPLLLFAYVGPVCSAAARRDSVLYLPTDIHSLLVNKPSSSSSSSSSSTFLLLEASLLSRRSTAVFTFYAGVARSRSGSS